MTTLARAAGNNDGVIVVDAPAPHPHPFLATIDEERMVVTSGSGTLFWSVMRGMDLTAPSEHDQGATVTPVAAAGGAGNYAPPIPQSDVIGLVAALVVKAATVDLSTAQIATLYAAPVEVLTAQGVGTAIVPVEAIFQFVVPTEPFGGNPDMYLGLGASLSGQVGVPLNGPARIASSRPTVGMATADADNHDLYLSTDGDPAITGSILTVALNPGGSGYAAGDAGTLTPDAPGGVLATYLIDTVSAPFAITALDQGAPSFTVAGDHSDLAGLVVVTGSTGNDGTYTLVSAIFGAGVTVITVVEAIPNATVDGDLGQGAPATFHITLAGTRYNVGLHQPQPTSGTGSADTFCNITAITPLTDARARVTVLYYVMDLRV